MTQPPLDDTQKMRAVTVTDSPPTPVSGMPPVDMATLLNPEEEYEETASGMGCGLSFMLLAVIGFFALAIVGLSGTAGWTSGQRTAQQSTTATANAEIDHQLGLIARDITDGNYSLADIRIAYLATEAPYLAQLPQLLTTGTALYLTSQPTITPTPTETATPTATEPGPTLTPTLAATATLSDPFDLGGRLQRAQEAMSVGQWRTAIDNLDVIIGIDANYESVRVRSMMSQALNTLALQLYRSNDLGEAIFLTDRAEEFGDIGELSFERYVAQLYISAKSRVGTSDYLGTINAISEIRRVAPNYQTNEINRLLFNNYVQYADALAYTSPCSAVQQYTNALQLFNDGAVQAKRSTNQTLCEFGTATPVGFVPDGNGSTGGNGEIAPIGQP